MATVSPPWINKVLRRWTQVIWLARGGATASCVLIAMEFTRRNYVWMAVQFLCLVVNVANIVFCMRHRKVLLAYQAMLTSGDKNATI
jgi:hypothetical protein